MTIWNQDNYIKAWNYASSAHNGQLVPGSTIPYINHIALVAMEAMTAVAYDDSINNPDLLVLSAILHDTIEDTESTYEDISEIFGANIANGVLALSKDINLPSKEEQMRDSLNRIKVQPKEIGMVKLADRITNLQTPPKYWNKAKINKYRDEASLILSELGHSNNYLATRLKLKIEAYRQYL